jgi:DNA-binding MarR family transcriptional regulator
MHAIFFGLKRAHHGTLRIARDVLARMGLTAARFDMLYALESRRRAGVLQSEVRRMLGVCRATVSRMLASLEELGLVKREPYPHDRRQRLVLLTAQGRDRIGYAHRQLIGSGWAQLAVDSALGGAGSKYHWYDKKECIAATLLLDGLLDQVRRVFFDRARLDYPYRTHLVDKVDPFPD